MKKVAIGVTGLLVVGSLGFTAYRLVSSAKSKAENVIINEKIESSKTSNSDIDETTKETVYNSNENSLESTLNNSPSTTSAQGNVLFNYSESDEYLNFSSADAFILSYNSLVDDVGTDISREDVFSTTSKARMVYSKVGNIVVEAYQFDGQINSVIITGKNVVDKVEGYLNGKAEVKFEDGNTVIYNINYTM